MTEFHNPGEVELSRDNLVWTVPNWGDEFEIEFDVMVNSEISQDWSNVFHMIGSFFTLHGKQIFIGPSMSFYPDFILILS